MKLKSIKKVIFNTIVAMLTYCFLVQPVYATTTYSIGDYKKFPQERSNWCWAASAQCSGYYLNPVPLTQTGAVLSVKGRVIDEAGSIFEIAEAANYFTMNKYNYVGYEQAFPIALFSGKIMKKHIPIACGGYYRGTRRTGGHATPVHMVYVANDNSKLMILLITKVINVTLMLSVMVLITTEDTIWFALQNRRELYEKNK